MAHSLRAHSQPIVEIFVEKIQRKKYLAAKDRKKHSKPRGSSAPGTMAVFAAGHGNLKSDYQELGIDIAYDGQGKWVMPLDQFSQQSYDMLMRKADKLKVILKYKGPERVRRVLILSFLRARTRILVLSRSLAQHSQCLLPFSSVRCPRSSTS